MTTTPAFLSLVPAREPWWRRWLAWLPFRREVQPAPGEFRAGSDFAAGQPAEPAYSVDASMSAYAAFPWVVAAVNAIVTDVCARRIRLFTGPEDDPVEILDHPVLDLLRKRPSSRVRASHFHRQRVFDRVLEGNSYTLVQGRGTLISLIRLHPKRTKPIPAADGQPESYQYGIDGAVTYPHKAIIHVRGASWEDGPEGLYGQGLIRALNDILNAERSSWKRQAESNKRGKPDGVVSPADTDLKVWSTTQAKDVRAQLDATFNAAHGGYAVVGQPLKFEKLSWSPVDLAQGDMRVETRDATLAAAGVPGTRVSLVSANYATALEQSLGYWNNVVRPIAREFDDADTEIAELFGPDLRIVRDFSDVPALQQNATDRLNRVRTHWLMGVPLWAAYRAEGLEPPEGIEESEPEPDPAPAPEDPGARAVGEWLRRAAERPTTEEARAARWRKFVADTQGPTEAILARRVQTALRKQREGVLRRLESVIAPATEGAPQPTERILTLEDLLRLFDLDAEDKAIAEAVEGPMRDALLRAFEEAVSAVGADLRFDPARLSGLLEVAQMVTRVNGTMRDAIRLTVTEGLQAGESIAQIQARVRTATAFAPSRALMIARTESTRAVNAGSAEAFGQAAATGLDVKKEWLSARDSAVRDSHAEMDGQIVPATGRFTAPSGATTTAPGGFGVAGEDINCRCTVLPVLE